MVAMQISIWFTIHLAKINRFECSYLENVHQNENTGCTYWKVTNGGCAGKLLPLDGIYRHIYNLSCLRK
jgi:hypothetical protein